MASTTQDSSPTSTNPTVGGLQATTITNDLETTTTTTTTIMSQSDLSLQRQQLLMSMEGQYIGYYFAHGFEVVNIKYNNQQKLLYGTKLTGDEYVPAGQITFKISTHQTLSDEELEFQRRGNTASSLLPLDAEGQIAGRNFTNPQFIPGRLLYISPDRKSFLFEFIQIGVVFFFRRVPLQVIHSYFVQQQQLASQITSNRSIPQHFTTNFNPDTPLLLQLTDPELQYYSILLSQLVQEMSIEQTVQDVTMEELYSEKGERGASEQLIRSHTCNRLVNEEFKCVICQNECKVGETCCEIVECKHSFHEECLYSWLRRCAYCPLCKLNLDKQTNTM